MLARLARWLRLLGADVRSEPALSGAELLRLAREDQRILLTRDKRLRTAHDVFLVTGDRFREQLREVLARFPFDTRLNAFTRCSHCNCTLREVARELVLRRVPPFVYASQDRFAECAGCGRVYWAATHPERILGELKSIGL
jgi:uncharacterized protein with PIN domain